MSTTDTELKVRSLRIDENTFEKFKNIASQEFGNQGQCLTALVNLYETENSKNSLVERKVEIESFQLYVNKLNELFISSLNLNQDAEERVKSNFEKLLVSKDNIIADLQDRLSKSISFAAEFNNNMSTIKEKLERKESKIKELEDDFKSATLQFTQNIDEKNLLNKTLEDSCKEKIALIQKLTIEIDDLKLELDKIKEYESRNKLLHESIVEYKSKISQLEDNIDVQKKQYEYQSEIKVLNMEKEKQKIVSDMQQLHNANITEYIEKIEEINLKYNKETNSLNNKIQDLFSKNNKYELENEKLKFQIQKLQSEMEIL